jgi:hypothetical protein
MKLSQIKKNPNNPRVIRDEKFEKLKNSIKSFPQMMSLRPIVVDESGTILGGNMRYEAIKALKMTEIPDEWVRRAEDLTEEEKKEFIVKDNVGFGEWDWDSIANEWSDLPLSDWGLDVPGFEMVEDETTDNDAEPQIDRAEELNKVWQVKSGDLWQIGEHRLLCGSSTSEEDVSRLMQGQSASLLATDPPYNVSIDYGENVDDDKSENDYEIFSRGWFENWQLHSERQIVTPGCYNLARWCRYFDPYHVAPWTKTNSMTNGKVSRFWCWEPVMFFGSNWSRSRSNDVFDFPIGQQKETHGHPCPKPLKMWMELIEQFTTQGDIVAEAFSGSGTTHVASENTKRKCFGMELEPKFCAVILERMKTAFPSLEIKRIEQSKTV